MRATFGRSSTAVGAAGIDDCDLLADIHGAAFRRGWSAAEFEAMLSQPGTHALIADYRNPIGRITRGGFALYRIVADEGEVISIAVTDDCRRRGLGRALLEELLRHCYREHVVSVTLEVEEANTPAIALYQAFDFEVVGERPGYYAQGRPRPSGAVVMRRKLR
ncbi:ribosomal protein S18-alanine N-acetyltransferase [Propylenella binzhouense]|uniref:Ribosomal-protein-alanine N-acetyltransferase n=1 Tax=Propylenella binzhouense TaxID=2555902 RepID=A0A964T347_9HYPH|nr:ribosomal protein S18-alanine N-acetyltransferase [Propylenella binzhouense]MYZ47424.1 ribosomal-protein-alanine N-acetyltransferase [Propylenella binzhouense]